MTEEEAKRWVADRWGGETVDRLASYATMLVDEASVQNLIARSTLNTLWARHLTDSAQLVALADGHRGQGDWIDIGTGAGVPGVIAAILQSRRVVMVEPRRRRVEFLERVTATLGLDAVVICSKVEAVKGHSAGVISARAVATLDALLAAAQGVLRADTIWILPKGQSAASEIAVARQTWQGVFHVEQSVTKSDSMIVIAREVRRR